MTLLTDHSPLLAALVRHAERRADRVALIDREERITYRDLWLRVRNVAGYLTENGVTPGDRIALSATKDSTFVYLYYAVHLAGGVAVIIDPTANAERKAFILRSTEPRLVFGLKGVEGNIDLKDVPLDRPAYDREDSFTSTLPAEILFTTGTTGLPKGVVLTHAHIAASAERISRFIGNDDSDVEVLGLPVCHSFGARSPAFLSAQRRRGGAFGQLCQSQSFLLRH